MVKLLRVIAFMLVVLGTVLATQPFSATDTHAAEPNANSIILADGGNITTHETTARTVGAFLAEQGIELQPNDSLRPNYLSRLENQSKIQINRAFYIDLVIDGEKMRKEVSHGTTSGQLFNNLQNNFRASLLFDGDRGELLEKDSVVEFSTMRSAIRNDVKFIPYTVEYHTTPSLSMGVEYVRQEGTNGERHIKSEVVYIANREHSREVIDEFVVEPTTRIVDRGVGGDLGTLTDTSCPSFHYVRRVTMNASAYTAGPGCTGKSPGHPLYGITASGRRVEHGIVAVDPRVIPLGTRLYVEGYGFALAADTGSAIRGYKIDLFMYDLADAIRFGRRDITVFILE